MELIIGIILIENNPTTSVSVSSKDSHYKFY